MKASDLWKQINDQYPTATDAATHIFNEEGKAVEKLHGLLIILASGIVVKYKKGNGWFNATTQQFAELPGISVSFHHLLDPNIVVSSVEKAAKRQDEEPATMNEFATMDNCQATWMFDWRNSKRGGVSDALPMRYAKSEMLAADWAFRRYVGLKEIRFTSGTVIKKNEDGKLVDATLRFKQAVEDLRRLGMTLTKRDGEYRVNFKGATEATMYYTDRLDDAYGTGMMMSNSKKR